MIHYGSTIAASMYLDFNLLSRRRSVEFQVAELRMYVFDKLYKNTFSSMIMIYSTDSNHNVMRPWGMYLVSGIELTFARLKVFVRGFIEKDIG